MDLDDAPPKWADPPTEMQIGRESKSPRTGQGSLKNLPAPQYEIADAYACASFLKNPSGNDSVSINRRSCYDASTRNMETSLKLRARRRNNLESTAHGLVASISTAIARLEKGENQQEQRMQRHEQSIGAEQQQRGHLQQLDVAAVQQQLSHPQHNQTGMAQTTEQVNQTQPVVDMLMQR